MELFVPLNINGISLKMESLDKLRKYIKFLEKWNNVHALTSVSPREIPYVFVVEPLLAAKALSEFVKPSNCIDIGTGFGNPGVAMSAYFENTKFSLLDSSQKKTALLRSALDMSGIENIEVMTSRIEDLPKERLNTFDLVVSRGVGSLEKVSSYAKELVKDDGIVAIFKARIDVEEASKVSEGLKFEKVINLNVSYPLKRVHRYVVVYKRATT